MDLAGRDRFNKLSRCSAGRDRLPDRKEECFRLKVEIMKLDVEIAKEELNESE